MMPLDWFLALERPDSQESFTGDGLARFGYLPNPKGLLNPFGLPVGFTQDPPVLAADKPTGWVGLTCAACHTNRIEYEDSDKKKTVMQIDGGPADADLFKFLEGVKLSLKATLDNEDKFLRFATKVGADNDKAKEDLRREVTRFSAYFSTFVDASTPKSTPSGPARVDAFGMIFNRVSGIDLSNDPKWAWLRPLEKNNLPPNAPVSYPYLYNVSRLDRVQWDGTAPNQEWYERLGRNVVECLGVFAKINLNKPSLANLNPGYPSTVDTLREIFIEEKLISSLKSPLWPEKILPPINQGMAKEGEKLYGKYCASCHAVIDRNGNSPVKVELTALSDIKTDPLMTENVACRKSDTGVLAGSTQPVFIGTHTLTNPDFTLNLATNVGTGAIVQAPLQLADGLTRFLKDNADKPDAMNDLTKFFNDNERDPEIGNHLSTFLKNHKEPLADQKSVTDQISKNLAEHPVFTTLKNDTGCVKDIEVYIGRPLAGIWASAPYLHNGSVPNLYQLLLPAKDRVKEFQVGSRKFDPVDVGFDTKTGSFKFDTSAPGNSNAGHEGEKYGTELNDQQRRQLVEYMKTL